MKTTMVNTLAGALLAGSLAACGGGGDEAATPTVTPQQYQAVAPKVGGQATYVETTVQLNGLTTQHSAVYTDNAITNGVMSVTSTDASSGAVLNEITQDLDRNRLTQTRTAGNTCTYAPKRDFYNFPLYVGKTWNPTWTMTCQKGYKETANVVATVQAAESVVTPAGTFNALRVRYETTYTKSNDGNFQNGATGNATYKQTDTLWWATGMGRFVKWETAYTYDGAVLDQTYAKTRTQVMTSVK